MTVIRAPPVLATGVWKVPWHTERRCARPGHGINAQNVRIASGCEAILWDYNTVAVSSADRMTQIIQ